MSEYKGIKELIMQQLLVIVDEKIEIANNAIQSATEARDNESKSSAGDKYETGREMMQIEIDKSTVQLNHAMHLKEELSRITVSKMLKKATFGSLIVTNQETYFLSIGIGKLMVNEENIYVISIDSPLGKSFFNKRVGEHVIFQAKELIIQEIR
jgi:transcription elongation GreA/GreB family factor